MNLTHILELSGRDLQKAFAIIETMSMSETRTFLEGEGLPNSGSLKRIRDTASQFVEYIIISERWAPLPTQP